LRINAVRPRGPVWPSLVKQSIPFTRLDGGRRPRAPTSVILHSVNIFAAATLIHFLLVGVREPQTALATPDFTGTTRVFSFGVKGSSLSNECKLPSPLRRKYSHKRGYGAYGKKGQFVSWMLQKTPFHLTRAQILNQHFSGKATPVSAGRWLGAFLKWPNGDGWYVLNDGYMKLFIMSHNPQASAPASDLKILAPYIAWSIRPVGQDEKQKADK
jgi:hypothetical protein